MTCSLSQCCLAGQASALQLRVISCGEGGCVGEAGPDQGKGGFYYNKNGDRASCGRSDNTEGAGRPGVTRGSFQKPGFK